MHYNTNMTGRKITSSKIPLTAFTIEDKKKITRCPADHPLIRSHYDEKSHVLSAHFDLNTCQQRPLKQTCRVNFKKKSTVLRFSQKTLLAAQTRKRIYCQNERQECTSKRAAIEGTNSALKRAQGAGKLRVRGLIKSKMVLGMKIIGHNFHQIARLFLGQIRKKFKKAVIPLGEGVPVSVC